MSVFRLQIVTPERMLFDGDVERVVVRTTTGDVCILKNHANYASALAIGEMKVVIEGKTRSAALAGGFIEVSKEKTTIVAVTCEWSDEIDLERAVRAKERAEQKLSEKNTQIAEIKLKKAINRINIAKR